jgi:transposase-like protein
MTSIRSVKMTRQERQNRYFSESFKVKKVQEIERGISKIAEICKEYEVSGTAVRKWILKYSTMKKKTEKMVVESKSDTQTIIELKKQIADLERRLGQKQVQLDFKDTMIDLAEEIYKIDIKKKLGTKPS